MLFRPASSQTVCQGGLSASKSAFYTRWFPTWGSKSRLCVLELYHRSGITEAVWFNTETCAASRTVNRRNRRATRTDDQSIKFFSANSLADRKVFEALPLSCRAFSRFFQFSKPEISSLLWSIWRQDFVIRPGEKHDNRLSLDLCIRPDYALVTGCNAQAERGPLWGAHVSSSQSRRSENLIWCAPPVQKHRALFSSFKVRNLKFRFQTKVQNNFFLKKMLFFSWIHLFIELSISDQIRF